MRRPLSYATYQRLIALVRFYFRFGLYQDGKRFPDPRSQELRDRGHELARRLALRRHAMIRSLR